MGSSVFYRQIWGTQRACDDTHGTKKKHNVRRTYDHILHSCISGVSVFLTVSTMLAIAGRDPCYDKGGVLR